MEVRTQYSEDSGWGELFNPSSAASADWKPCENAWLEAAMRGMLLTLHLQGGSIQKNLGLWVGEKGGVVRLLIGGAYDPRIVLDEGGDTRRAYEYFFGVGELTHPEASVEELADAHAAEAERAATAEVAARNQAEEAKADLVAAGFSGLTAVAEGWLVYILKDGAEVCTIGPGEKLRPEFVERMLKIRKMA